MTLCRGILMVAVLGLAGNALAQSRDVQVGTWVLDIDKSQYQFGAIPPKPTVIKIEPIDGGHKFVSDGVTAKGQVQHIEYTALYDGRDYTRHVTIDGKTDSSTMVSIVKVDERTFDVVFKNARGNIVAHQRTEFAEDGGIRTNKISGLVRAGKPYVDIVVYVRQ